MLKKTLIYCLVERKNNSTFAAPKIIVYKSLNYWEIVLINILLPDSVKLLDGARRLRQNRP